jgi:hypothetical protein
VIRADDRVVLPLAHLLSSFDMRWLITQVAPVRDLAPSVPFAGVAVSILLLAEQVVLQQLAAYGLVGINLLVKRLMADWHFGSNLLRNPRLAQQIGGLLAHLGVHSSSRLWFAQIALPSAHRHAWAKAFEARGCKKASG